MEATQNGPIGHTSAAVLASFKGLEHISLLSDPKRLEREPREEETSSGAKIEKHRAAENGGARLPRRRWLCVSTGKSFHWVDTII